MGAKYTITIEIERYRDGAYGVGMVESDGFAMFSKLSDSLIDAVNDNLDAIDDEVRDQERRIDEAVSRPPSREASFRECNPSMGGRPVYP